MEHLTNDEIVLAGLGATSRTSSNRGFKMDIGASTYRKQFIERVNQLPKTIQNDLKTEKAMVQDSPFYATAQIHGTRTELIKLSTPEQLGITNIDNGKLGKDQYLTVSGIKLQYDRSSINGSFTDQFPIELINGEWELVLNRKKVFSHQQIRSFDDGYFGYDTNKAKGLYLLNHPKLIHPQTPIEFNINTAGEVQGFVRVSFEGTVVSTY